MDGRLLLNSRVPVSFREDDGNLAYTVRAGDTPWSLSFRFFRNVPTRFRSMLFFILLEFQPEPIIDPTRELAPGTTIIIPGETLVLELLARAATER